MKIFWALGVGQVGLLFIGQVALAAPAQGDLHELLKRAYGANASLLAAQSAAQAQAERAGAPIAMADPMIGVKEVDMGDPRRSWMIEQKFQLPGQSKLRSHIAQVESEAIKLDADQFQLNLRAQLVAAWYGLQAVLKIKGVSRNDLDKLRELSRIAESQYAAGTSAMQDFMQAHFMQTEIESDLIELDKEESELRARIAEIIAMEPEGEFRAGELGEIFVPTLRSDANLSAYRASSPGLRAREKDVESAVLATRLARWQFAPEFQVTYEQSFTDERPQERMIAMQMSVPLWFWGKSADSRAAAISHQQKEHELFAARQRTEAGVKTLLSRARNDFKMLEIIKTSLIPQATTSYEANHGAFKARRASFKELLESERSLLRVEVTYWRTLARYVESVAQLEAALGYAISDLVI